MSIKKCKCGERTLFSVCDNCRRVYKYKEVCEECGKETAPICFHCAVSGVEKLRKKFLDCLSNEQRILFNEYNDATRIRTSVIILD